MYIYYIYSTFHDYIVIDIQVIWIILFEGFHLTCWHVSLGNGSLVEFSSEGFCERDFVALS